jgi:hypothetical protein
VRGSHLRQEREAWPVTPLHGRAKPKASSLPRWEASGKTYFSGFNSPNSVGSNSVTVGWMCMVSTIFV